MKIGQCKFCRLPSQPEVSMSENLAFVRCPACGSCGPHVWNGLGELSPSEMKREAVKQWNAAHAATAEEHNLVRHCERLLEQWQDENEELADSQWSSLSIALDDRTQALATIVDQLKGIANATE